MKEILLHSHIVFACVYRDILKMIISKYPLRKKASFAISQIHFKLSKFF